MIVIIILVSSLHLAQSACATYQKTDNGFRNCNEGPTLVGFSQEFCAIPQIILTGMQYQRSAGSETFRFQILTIDTKSFQFQLDCVQGGVSLYFLWAALIDNQLFVINDLMSSITLIDGYRTALIPYPTQNTEYEISYSIISYAGGSPNIVLEKQATGFNLYVTGVSGAQLSGLGVQIIVGLKSLYKFLDTMSITCPNIMTPFPKAPQNTFLPTEIPIVSLLNIHDFIQKIYSDTYINRNLTYTDSVCHTDKPVNYKLYIYDFKYQPHYYKKIRVGHVMSLDHRVMLSFITQKLYFKEIAKTWSDIDTVSIPMMQYNDARISLVYHHACQPDRKITVTILRQGDQGGYNYIYTQYCHRLYNLITMYINLFSQRYQNSELQFSLTATGLQEKMLDTGNTYVLLKIEYPS